MDTSDHCLQQALKAEADAAGTTLPNVRERALQAAQRWRVLAAHAKGVERERERERAAWYREAAEG